MHVPINAAAALRAARAALRLTQAEAAGDIVSEGSYLAAEHGRACSETTWTKLADAYAERGIDLAALASFLPLDDAARRRALAERQERAAALRAELEAVEAEAATLAGSST